jgi:hypothetical protein
MSDYERYTAYPIRDVFRRAEEIFSTQLEAKLTEQTPHSVTYTGPEGTVMIEAHRHNAETLVIGRTDQLRTSRLDEVVRYLMNQLPYLAGDRPKGPMSITDPAAVQRG